MSRSRAYRVLCVLSAVAALWAIAVALLVHPAPATGALLQALQSPYYPLVLGIASGLSAWAVSIGAPEEMRTSPPLRNGRFVARLALMMVALNLLLLAQPAPPQGLMACQFVNPLGRGFHHFLNCDSPEYLGLAKEPSLVLTHGILQARPLSFGIPFLVSQPLRLVPRLEKAGPYRPYAPQFVAYLFMNLAALLAALVFFTRTLESGTGRPAGIELLFSLVVLGANDVTKLFVWTPHTQIFNLLVPCFTVYLCFRLLQRAEPLAPARALALGLGLGIGALLYGLFVVSALCVSAIHVLIYRRWRPAILVCVGVLLPYACWAAIVYGLIGSFYNHEVGMYRQFVWMADCAVVTITACVPAAQTRLLALFNAAAPVLMIPVLLAIGCRVASYVWPAAEPQPRPSTALGKAIAFTLVINGVFLLLQGAAAPRLCWQLVPPILLVIAFEFQTLRFAWPRSRMRSLNVGVALIAVAYVAVLAARQGPYN